MRLLTLGLGAWAFAPTPLPTLAALALFALTVALGNWQIGRADAKRAQQARYDAALSQAPIRLGTARLDPDQVLYRRLEVEGGFEAAHTILIDNRVLNGVAGYHVLTPLRIRNSRRSVLVNRGWVAVGGSRDRVPVFPTPAGPVRLEGIAADPNARFVELADSPPQGRVWQNLDFARYARASGLDLQPILLLQTTESGDGLRRHWPRPDTGVRTHLSYAFQWYGLAATLVVLWLAMNVRRRLPGAATQPVTEHN